MMSVWKIEPHTVAKHEILRRYLQGYYPKMASTQSRIVFVDGFAGPGMYVGGEDGSPVIALDSLVEHRHFPKMRHCEFEFLFIERERPRFEALRRTVDGRQPHPNVKVSVRHGTFEEHMGQVLDSLGEKRMAPAFVMVDPFGVKGLPLDLLRRLASFPGTELLVTFIYESMSRFLGSEEFEPHLDGLFGTTEWRQAMNLRGVRRKEFLSDLYARQLRGIGMEHVRLFEMRDVGNRTEYFLAFATHHVEGLRVMKEAMWKVDQAGGMTFSDFTVPSQEQATLFETEPNDTPLRRLMLDRFAGQQGVPVETINNFVLVETAFLEKHGRALLRDAEEAGRVTVERPPERTRAYWNVGTRVTFR